MIRILFIGRPASSWAERIGRSSFEVEADAARLPAAGVRQLETTPPDVVVLVDESSSNRPLTLVSAIRERPLGSLTPIILLCPDDASQAAHDEGGVDAWLEPGVTLGRLLATIGDILEIDDFGGAETEPRRPTLPPSEAYDDDAFVLEEIPEESGPRRMAPREIFGERYVPMRSEDVGEDDLRRKLRAVRHEDYFAILEVPRGAQTSTIRDAFHKLASRWGREGLDFDLTHRYHAELGEIRDAFEDAWAVLGDPKLRAAYLEQTTRK